MSGGGAAAGGGAPVERYCASAADDASSASAAKASQRRMRGLISRDSTDAGRLTPLLQWPPPTARRTSRGDRMHRRHLLRAAAAAPALAALPAIVRAQGVEKPKLTIAVGGKNLLYYLPLTIAETLGYFKAEGLEVNIVDFAGCSQALRAVVGGSADVVSGAFEHTVNMQVKGQCMRAFVLQGRAPQIVLGVNPKTLP